YLLSDHVVDICRRRYATALRLACLLVLQSLANFHLSEPTIYLILFLFLNSFLHTLFFFFFFFSSRRRHTRCLSDWSSDVCSSDLSITDDQRFFLHGIPQRHCITDFIPMRWHFG